MSTSSSGQRLAKVVLDEDTAHRLSRRRLVRNVAVSSAAIGAAVWIKPDMRQLGIPVALAASGPPPKALAPACDVTFEGTSNVPAGEPAGMAQYNANIAGVVNVQDAALGVVSIQILTNDNFLTAIPDAAYNSGAPYNDHFHRFSPGSLGTVTYTPANTTALQIWAVRINPNLGAQLIIRIQNSGKLLTVCDPDVAVVTAASSVALPSGTRQIEIDNGAAGLTSLQITANGYSFTAADLKGGEVRTITLDPAVVNAASDATVTGFGAPGSSAVVLSIQAA